MRGLKRSIAVTVVAAATITVNMGGVGLGSAHAVLTTLCKAAQETCAQENRFLANTMLEMSTGKVVFANSLSNVTCTGSTFRGRDTAEAGEPLPIEITAVNAPQFSGCTTASGTGCTVTSVNAPYRGEISWTSANNGAFKMVNAGSGVPGVDVKCGGVINCRLTAEVQYTMEGGSPKAKIKVTGAVMEVTGFICPSKAELTVDYAVNSPAPIYVAHI